MPEQHVTEARVLAALAVLGWPDDRGGYPDEPLIPDGALYRAAEEAIAAADAAGPDGGKHLAEITDISVTISHPRTCVEATCRVSAVPDAFDQLEPLVRALRRGAGGRAVYEIEANDIGDRLLILDRVDVEPAPPEPDRWVSGGNQMRGPAWPTGDHPHTDPGDGRTECERCGKWVFPAIHSCKGGPVTDRARARFDATAPPESARP